MSTILGNITLIVAECVNWVEDFIGVITGNPLIELFVIIPVVGLGIGVIRRLLNL